MDFIGVKNRLLTSQKNHSVIEIFLNHVNLLKYRFLSHVQHFLKTDYTEYSVQPNIRFEPNIRPNNRFFPNIR
jgi:hypothetical protein